METFLREYPSLCEDFRTFAQEGRFEIAAGMYTMADINMSSGESILRQLIIGKQWCKRTLGLSPRVLDMGDCTGHPVAMPQIARTCEYDYFVFERAIDDVNRKCEINWQGIDGTQIFTYWLGVEGYAGWGNILDDDKDQQNIEHLCKRLDHHCLSNQRLIAHGGDFQYPYERGIASVEKWNAAHDEKIVYSTYERALDAVDFSNAPRETCEWNPDRTGCYSSRIRIKQNNRTCESLLFTAESISALAQQFYSVTPDTDGLMRAWKLTCINQFHDTLWGTTCDHSYENAINRSGRIKMICQDIIEDRLKLTIPHDNQQHLAIFNPLPWSRKYIVDLPNGSVNAQLPACGITTFAIDQVIPSTDVYPFTVHNINETPNLETPFYDITFGSGGVITSLRTKTDDIEFVDPSRPAFNALCYQTDQGDLWQYYDGPLHDGGLHGPAQDLIGDPYPTESYHRLSKNGRRCIGDVLDNRTGPQAHFSVDQMTQDKLVISITGVLNRKYPEYREFHCEGIRIEWSQKITFYADDPQIDIQLNTHHVTGNRYRIRTAFFTDIKDGTICHEIPFGQYERPEGEFAAQNYIAYYDDTKGLALLNKGLPGNNVTDDVMMLSLMRSVSIETRTESKRAFELGEHHQFDYAIIPFAGRKALNSIHLARRGQEFIHVPYIYNSRSKTRQNLHRITSVPVQSSRVGASLVELTPESITCTAIYLEGENLIVRLYESQGKPAEAKLIFARPLQSVQQTNALLQGETDKKIDTKTLMLQFKPFEIKTIVVTFI